MEVEVFVKLLINCYIWFEDIILLLFMFVFLYDLLLKKFYLVDICIVEMKFRLIFEGLSVYVFDCFRILVFFGF